MYSISFFKKSSSYTLFLILISLLFINSSCSNKQPSQADYDGLAADISNCVEKNCIGLSNDMKNSIIHASEQKAGDMDNNIENEIESFIKDNPDKIGQIESDIKIMDKAGKEIESCIASLQKNFIKKANIREDDEKKILDNVVASLKKNEKFRLAHAFFLIGMKASKSEVK